MLYCPPSYSYLISQKRILQKLRTCHMIITSNTVVFFPCVLPPTAHSAELALPIPGRSLEKGLPRLAPNKPDLERQLSAAMADPFFIFTRKSLGSLSTARFQNSIRHHPHFMWWSKSRGVLWSLFFFLISSLIVFMDLSKNMLVFKVETEIYGQGP